MKYIKKVIPATNLSICFLSAIKVTSKELLSIVDNNI